MLSFQHIFRIFSGILTIPSLGFFILTIILSIFNTNTPKNIDLEDQSFPIDTIMEGFSTMSQDTIFINVRNSKMCVYWKNSDEITVYPAKIPAYISISEIKAIDNCPNVSTSKNLKSDDNNNDNDLTTFIDLVPTMFGSSFNGTNKGISITLAIVSCVSLFLMSLLSNKDNIIELIEKIKEYKNNSTDDSNTNDHKINVNAKGNGINVVVNVSKKSEDENKIEIKNKTTLKTETELKDEENPKDLSKNTSKYLKDNSKLNHIKDQKIENKQDDKNKLDKQPIKENLSSQELKRENISTDTQIKINQQNNLKYNSQRNSLNNSPRNYVSINNDSKFDRRANRQRSNSPRNYSPRNYSPESRLSRPCSKNHSRKNSDQFDPEFLDDLSGTQTPVKRRLSLKNLPTNVSELTFNTNENGNIDLELELAPEDMYTPRTINDETENSVNDKNINSQNIIDNEFKRLQKEISVHEIQDKK